jgi:hypothetical protein
MEKVIFRYLGKTVAIRNCVCKEISADHIRGILAATQFKIFLPFHVLAKSPKINTYKTILLPVALYGCGT